MSSLTLAVASAVLIIPREYHIDWSGWTGAAVVEVAVRITEMDGTVRKTTIEVQPDTTPEQVRDAVWCHLETTGWRGRKVGKGIFVLEGAKESSIRSVEFTSKGWKPDVRVVFVVPDKK